MLGIQFKEDIDEVNRFFVSTLIKSIFDKKMVQFTLSSMRLSGV